MKWHVTLSLNCPKSQKSSLNLNAIQAYIWKKKITYLRICGSFNSAKIIGSANRKSKNYHICRRFADLRFADRPPLFAALHSDRSKKEIFVSPCCQLWAGQNPWINYCWRIVFTGEEPPYVSFSLPARVQLSLSRMVSQHWVHSKQIDERKCSTLQMHCTENSKQIFSEMKLCGLLPNFYILVSVSDLYIPTIGPQTQNSKIDGPIVGLYKSLTDTWM